MGLSTDLECLRDNTGLREVDLLHINANYAFLQRYFAENTNRKNYFLAACAHIYPKVDLEIVNDVTPYGGIIGVNNSSLDCYLKHFKIFRLHAILHDAAGYMKTVYNKGPGYSYVLPMRWNCCFIGHLSGLPFCIFIKYFKSETFEKLHC